LEKTIFWKNFHEILQGAIICFFWVYKKNIWGMNKIKKALSKTFGKKIQENYACCPNGVID